MSVRDLAVPAFFVLIGSAAAALSIRRFLALRRTSYCTRRKVVERIVLSLVVLASATLAGNSAYDALFPGATYPPGTLYLVHGHKMRIDCTGAGSPTILLDAGLGNDGLIWGDLQPALSTTTRVCSYDRAGFGWSDGVQAPGDADHIVAELHGLLAAARVNGPLVLMGHSIAGLYIRDYAAQYPTSVAGLIFIDGSIPPDGGVSRRIARNEPQQIQLLFERAAFYVGLPRLFGACPGSVPGYELRTVALQFEDLCREQLDAFEDERNRFDQSAEEAARTASFGAMPILIFSRDTTNSVWNQKQESLKKLSTRSRRIIARGSGHYIQLKRRDLVETEVTRFIMSLRGKISESADYGTTKVE